MSIFLDNLPTDVLLHIFSYLNHSYDFLRVSLTCKRFNDLIIFLTKDKRCYHLPVEKCRLPDHFSNNKLHLTYFSKRFRVKHRYWLNHGQNIAEMNIECSVDLIAELMQDLETYFGSLKRLKITTEAEKKDVFVLIKAIDVQLDLLTIDGHFSAKSIDDIVSYFPTIKKLHLNDQITDWKVPGFELYLKQWLTKAELIEFSLSKKIVDMLLLVNFPSDRIVFPLIAISAKNETLENFVKFFSIRRKITQLYMYDSYFLFRDKFEIMAPNLQVQTVIICERMPYFQDSVERFAALNGLKELKILKGDSGFFRNKLSDAACSKITLLYYNPSKRRDEALKVVSRFWALKDLICSNSVLDSKLLQAVIMNCPNLETLVMAEAKLTDADVRGSKQLNLRPISDLKCLKRLELWTEKPLSERTIARFFNFPKLEQFHAVALQISYPKLINFCKNCPKLQLIELFDCFTFDSNTVKILQTHLKYLKKVKLIYTDPNVDLQNLPEPQTIYDESGIPLQIQIFIFVYP